MYCLASKGNYVTYKYVLVHLLAVSVHDVHGEWVGVAFVFGQSREEGKESSNVAVLLEVGNRRIVLCLRGHGWLEYARKYVAERIAGKGAFTGFMSSCVCLYVCGS